MENNKKTVAVIIGSPRKGNTYSVCEEIIRNVKMKNPNVDFEYFHLKNFKIEMCRGCHICLLKGIERCPVKDDIRDIFQKIKPMDAFILASPGYNQMVLGIMKNFIDRMSFNCHEPGFIGKNALVISTVGGMGSKEVSNYLRLISTVWGGHVFEKLSVLIDYKNNLEKYRNKLSKKIEEISTEFNNVLNSDTKPRPNLYDLNVFASLREETRFSEHFRQIWIDNGWANQDYYYDENINPVYRYIARTLGFIVKKEMSAVFKEKP